VEKVKHAADSVPSGMDLLGSFSSPVVYRHKVKINYISSCSLSLPIVLKHVFKTLYFNCSAYQFRSKYVHRYMLLYFFNKTEASVFSCRLCFLRAFPFIRLILPAVIFKYCEYCDNCYHWYLNNI